MTPPDPSPERDSSRSARPLVGITADLTDHANGLRVFTYQNYAAAIDAAGGTPVLLPPIAETASDLAARLDAFVFTGGDDPFTEPFGEPTDPRVTPVHPERQRFESALLRAIIERAPDTPVLGVCLGMQMQALVAGGRLDQFMPDTLATHADHWEHHHAVLPTPAAEHLPPALRFRGTVRSKHHQAVADPGTLTVIATAPDGTIEAICDPARRFWVGVQWHPERTDQDAVGQTLYQELVCAAQTTRAGAPACRPPTN